MLALRLLFCIDTDDELVSRRRRCCCSGKRTCDSPAQPSRLVEAMLWVQKFRQLNLSHRNIRAAFLQCDGNILCVNTLAQSAVWKNIKHIKKHLRPLKRPKNRYDTCYTLELWQIWSETRTVTCDLGLWRAVGPSGAAIAHKMYFSAHSPLITRRDSQGGCRAFSSAQEEDFQARWDDAGLEYNLTGTIIPEFMF